MTVKIACAAALAACALTAACARPESIPAPKDTLRIGFGTSAGNEAKNVLADVLYSDSLLTLDWQGRTVGRLATSWTWSEDGRALTLSLKQGVKLHDGRPFDSAFAAAAIERRRSITRTNGYAYLTAIERPNPTTLVLRLSRPDTLLLDALSLTPMIDGDIGTGPYKLLSRDPVVRAVRNPDYYQGTPGAAAVSFVPYDTQRAAWAALLRHDVDAVQEVSRDSVDFLQGASDIATYASIRAFYIPLIFNLNHPILQKVEVRRALVEAIDRDEIVNAAMRGHAMVADDPIWPYHWAYSAAGRRHSFNPTAARMRLDAAGFPVRPPAPGHMASRFVLTCAFWEQGPQFERIALLLQRQMAAVGVDLQVEPLSQPELLGRVAQGRYDAFVMQLASGRTFDWPYTFWHSPAPGAPPLLNSGYTGADETLERLRVARADSEIRAGLADLRQRFYDDVPAAFLAWPETTRAIRTNFDVGERTVKQDVFSNLWQWRPAAPGKVASR
ncbi:MAG TPA: ABC transporter substrate-binding protein [Vicinamibacterales bacterium]